MEPSAVALLPSFFSSSPKFDAPLPGPGTSGVSAPPVLSATILDLPVREPLSGELVPGLSNPLPGGVLAGYAADTGLDIAARHSRVYAVAAGMLDYSEEGHSRWTWPSDSPLTVRILFDTPIAWKGRRITHAYYGHLSSVAVVQHEAEARRHHVVGGQWLGISGQARGAFHLHLGLLLDGDVTQQYYGTMLSEAEIRELFGHLRNGRRLPK